MSVTFSDGRQMITIVEPYNVAEHRHHLDQMFRQRARVFRDQLGWDVTVNQDLERDKFDDMSPVYIIDVTGDEVCGSLRLLPTTGPTLSEEMFTRSVVNAPTIWELSRLCMQSVQIAINLLTAVAELSVQRGIETIIANTQRDVMNLVKSIGFDVKVLDYTDMFGERVFLCSAPMDKETIERIKSRRKIKSRCL